MGWEFRAKSKHSNTTTDEQKDRRHLGDSPLSQRSAIAKVAIAMQCINFCIPALGSGQRFLYRLWSGLGLVLVLVLRFCVCPADFCDSGPESSSSASLSAASR